MEPKKTANSKQLSGSEKMQITRRQFLKLTGSATAALGLAHIFGSPQSVFARVPEFGAPSWLAAEPRLSFCDNPCTHNCGRTVYVDGGRIVHIEGLATDRFTRGKLCVKGLTAVGDTYNPDRILYPLKREGQGWVRVSWEQALDEIAARLRELRRPWMERGGISQQTEEEKELVAFYTTPRVRAEGLALLYRFKRAFSARPHYGGCQACGGNILRAAKSLFGYMFRSNLDTDLPQSKYVVLWASNWASTMPVAFQFILEAQANGAKVVCIDPRYTASAARADQYIPIRPATDGALALGILHVLFAENLTYPRLNDYVVEGDVDKLRELVSQYDPETVSRITWVPADTIRQLAREMAAAGRKVSFVLGSALSAQLNGYQSSRAVMLIPVVLGAFGVPGSGIHGKPGVVGVMNLPTTGTTVEWWRFGPGKVDDIYDPGDQPPSVTREGMVAGRVKVLFASGSLLARTPNSDALRQGLERLKAEGLVVHLTMFHDGTADYAHYILPICSEFEEGGSNLMVGSIGAVRWKEKAIEPLGESKPYWWIWNELGRRVYGDELCTETTTGNGMDNPEYQKPLWPYEIFSQGPEAIYTYYMTVTSMMMTNMQIMTVKAQLMKQGLDEATAMAKAKEMGPQMNPYAGMTLDNVKAWSPKGGVTFPCPPMMADKGGMPFLFMNPDDPEVPKFMTPDGKIHIDMGERWHHAGLPEFRDVQEEPEDKSENINWSEEYPLIMTTNKPTAVHMHWATRWDVLSRAIEPEVFVELHPQTAAHLGISSGDRVRVSTPRGAVVMRAILTERIHPKVVNVPPHAGPSSPTQGLRTTRPNALTLDEPGEHTEMPGWKTAKCRVERV
jgi:anaerobic selenocysteine-containing dehydrogenase